MNEKSSQDLLNELTAGKFTEEERAQMNESIDRFVKFIKEISYANGLNHPVFHFQFMEDYLRCSTSREELESRIDQIFQRFSRDPMTTPFQNLTYEDREIWLRVLQRTNLWALSLLSKDHYVDVDVFNSKMITSEDQETQE